MDFLFSLQCSSPSAERHFRFPVVVTGVTTLTVEQCPVAPEAVSHGFSLGYIACARSK